MGFDTTLYAVAEAVGAIVVAALLWWGGIEILDGTLTFGVLVAFMQYTQRFYLPIRDASAKFSVMQAATVSAERVFALLDTPPEVGGTVVPVVEAAGDARLRHAGDAGAPRRRPPALELRDVWFAYPGAGEGEPARGAPSGTRRRAWALRGVSLRIETGERIAVVGGTGAGKTTLARLLTRTYDVQRGAVLVEGVDVREWDLTALRQHVGLVLQDVVLYAGTVAENLTLGRDLPRAMVEDVARRVHADAFIRSLAGAYEAPLLERGANLSHGQRQLLSVARALLYNPPVLVLDEATSSVDPETEHLLQDAINQLIVGRTSMVIAHRLSTIQGADRVLVLQHGQLVDEGPHVELLRRDGLYRTLWELQFGPDASGERPGGRRRRAGMTGGLDKRVHALVRRVPAGRVVTYGQLAALAGAPRAARAVGHAMRVCPAGVPWHRVVNGRGAISRRGDGSGALTQRLLLEGEGVRFARGRIDLRALRVAGRDAVPARPAVSGRSSSRDPAGGRARAGRPPGPRRRGRGDRARRERAHGGPGRRRLRRGRGTDREVARLPGGRRAHPGARVRREPGGRAAPRRAQRPAHPPGRRRRRARVHRLRDRRRPARRPSRGRSACSSTATSSATIV